MKQATNTYSCHFSVGVSSKLKLAEFFSALKRKYLSCKQIQHPLTQKVENLPLLAVPGDGPNLLGRNWLMKLKI